MKAKLSFSFGMALGTLLYAWIAHGFDQIDWYKGGFIFIFFLILTSIFPKLFLKKEK
jgi:hypothetical protein